MDICVNRESKFYTVLYRKMFTFLIIVKKYLTKSSILRFMWSRRGTVKKTLLGRMAKIETKQSSSS